MTSVVWLCAIIAMAAFMVTTTYSSQIREGFPLPFFFLLAYSLAFFIIAVSNIHPIHDPNYPNVC